MNRLITTDFSPLTPHASPRSLTRWRSAFILVALNSFVLACLALSSIAKARQPSEDRGNGNSAAENVDALNLSTTGSNSTAHGWFSLFSNTSGSFNTADGFQTLYSNTTGNNNTAIGYRALYSNASGNANTAIGDAALFFNTGSENTATGYQALEFNTTGTQNTAYGFAALHHNSTGNYNTAVGNAALISNSTGTENTAVGYQALLSNTAGPRNTAVGYQALRDNIDAPANTAIGRHALRDNNSGSANTAVGDGALASSASGFDNTAVGAGALDSTTDGFGNTAVGKQALQSNHTGDRNTGLGDGALFTNTTGRGNIALGASAGHHLTGDNNIDIGNEGVAGESNTIRIGGSGILTQAQTRTFIAGISGQTAPDGVAVYVSSDGKLGTVTSSKRFKQDIRLMDKTSEAIFALKPVAFRYKDEIDPNGLPQFGLVAEDVEKVNPDLVARDAKGEIFSVRYDAVNAMLLNEFLKEHKTVQQLKATVAQQKQQIDALTAGLQKVSARIEASKLAPQVVLNNP